MCVWGEGRYEVVKELKCVSNVYFIITVITFVFPSFVQVFTCSSANSHSSVRL